MGTPNVLGAARDAGVRRVIYSGSSSVYGDQPHLPLREDMHANPLNPYVQKRTGERYVRLFHRLLFNGDSHLLQRVRPVDASEGAYLTVIIVFRRARREGKPLTIHRNGQQRRDFTYVRDVVQANLLAMDCAIADGRAMNVGRGH